MARDLILEPAMLANLEPIATLEEIRQFNRQRFEFEQLQAVIYEDIEHNICAGYRDVRDDEFWVRGHMPEFPLLPGVLLCESAAQLASYYAGKHQLLGGHTVGLGGLDEVRFRGMVQPKCRLYVVTQLTRISPGRMIICRFQQFVDESLVCEGQIKGIPLNTPPER